MKILLTGAGGFTGRAFAQQAVQAGHTVHPLQADLTDKQAVAAEVAALDIDAVVHLAAISFVDHADDAAFYAVNVVGTMNLLSALAALPRRLQSVLLASSANVYGNCDTSPIAEKQAPAPVNHYAMSKLAMEHMAHTYADRLPLVITRPFNYTGPGQHAPFLIPKLVRHFVQRDPVIELGNVHVEREFNDIRMVCAAYLLLLQHGQVGQTYNICSGQAHPLQSVIEQLTALTGHRPQIQINPAFVRANEVHRLAGQPTQLQSVFAQAQVPWPNYTLTETLRAMLASNANPADQVA
jgi:nucleoside-diphosphate-sugar epimerase